LLQQATPAATTPPNLQAEFVHRSAWKAGVLGTLNVLFAVIATRLILLVSVIGAIVLATIAVREPDPWRLGALAIYALVVVCPTVWLASRR
jgi:hypothetical protein